ncbi:hypothetical protein BGX33_012081 [Mortierella sp. NVP41]|nr:hypothetical protein BGX33_012081 [Mortierella sp. NVP41]
MTKGILHPLELPEILYLLASTLSNDIQALSKCARVSRTWHGAFSPQLWRILSCTRLLPPMGHLSREAIDRNVHLVHQMRVGRIDRLRYGTLERCTNLRRLLVEDERVSEWDLLTKPYLPGSAAAATTAAAGAATGMIATTTTTRDDKSLRLGYDGDDEDDDFTGDQWVQLLIGLVKQNPSLQKVCLLMERFEPTTAFWDAIESATATRKEEGEQGGGGALKSLECVFTKFPTPQLVDSFLGALTRMEFLVLQYCTFESFPISLLQGRQYPFLQSLTLATNTGLGLSTQLELIQCFPNLQSLSWSIIGSLQPLVSDICTLLREKCPKIESLVLSDRTLIDPSDVAQILGAISRLVRFFLRFDSLLLSMFNTSEVMDAMRRHFGTLTDLEFGQVRSTIRCGTVLEFLRSCPRLERLVAYGRLDCSRQGMMHFCREERSRSRRRQGHSQEKSEGEGLVDEEEEEEEEGMTKDEPWVCLGLKTLHVIMTGDPENVWLNRSLQQRLFLQLGRLSNLQTLSLGHCILWMYENGYSHHGLDFTLEAGLAKLKDLRKLEELNLEGIYQHMGERDVEWMLGHWPRLRVVEGELHHRKENRRSLDLMMEQKGFKILNHSYRK